MCIFYELNGVFEFPSNNLNDTLTDPNPPEANQNEISAIKAKPESEPEPCLRTTCASSTTLLEHGIRAIAARSTTFNIHGSVKEEL